MMYRAGSDLQLGVEYNPRSSQAAVGPLLNLRLLRETADRPSATFGLSSDRIGTPTGEAYYVTVGKSLRRELGLPIAPYVAVLHGTFERKVIYPFGVSASLGNGFTVFVSNDGHSTHPMLTYAWQRYSVTFLMVRSRDPGFTFSVGF